MPGVDDFECPQLSALLGLLDAGEPLNMRGFAVAARVSPATARRVLDRVVAMGFVRVEREERGATQVLYISLTPRGGAVAERVRDLDETLGGRRRRG